MMKRYVQLRDFLPSLRSNELDTLTLNVSENRRIDALISRLDPLQSVTKALQGKDTTMNDTRAMFDAIIDHFSNASDKVSASARIVHCPKFENAIVKIQRGQ